MRRRLVVVRAWTGRVAVLAASVMIAVTFVWAPGVGQDESGPLFAAATALVALQAAAFRWAPRQEAALGVGLAAVALVLWPQPFVPDASLYERVGMGAFWFVPTLGAAVVGGYPRLMEHRRRRAVHEARLSQQLAFAHDLHDFVAHDISGIVAQAQAARFVAGQNPDAVAGALERIERAGLAALASLDRTVHLLREPGREADRAPLPSAAHLIELVSRFDETGRTRARIDIAPGVETALSREAAATVHRVTTEALTNVRRHAPDAAGVEVALVLEDGAVRLTVTNDTGGGRPRARESGGTGLRALTERVRALGGSLHTSADDGTWRLTVTLPTPHLTSRPASLAVAGDPA
ncbi:sensor histidine kinase [Streptomyces rimosus]|uniref:sensor histidine kinase n=1 Tax=Streptomyces rimosus TaxID=1927 RepID=UPI00099B9562|nr:histidine kinase [Streptomyces rimosus]